MLPGFRFLFAATMLSMSLLVFGLGAAALLRAAHESFASNSSWRGAPEVTFTQRNDAMPPVLATLSVEPVAEKPAEAAKVVAAPVEPVPSPTESANPDQAAALSPAEAPAAETAKSDVAPVDMELAQNPPPPEVTPAAPAIAAAPAVAEAATTGETKTATASDAPSDNSAPAMTQPEPVVPQPTPTTAAPATTAEPSVAATKIATLGGPPVDIAVKDKTARPGRASDDPNAIQKRVHARRIAHRRMLSARARLAAQQLQQQQANPFGPPAVPATPARQRQPQ
ncbi:MAG: hypothetical protein ABSG88_20315 [Bradyrhizobium sp.]